MGEISVSGRVSWACLNRACMRFLPQVRLGTPEKEITKLLLGAGGGERGHLLFSFVFLLVRVEPG